MVARLIILTFVLAVGICCEVLLGRWRWPLGPIQKSTKWTNNQKQVVPYPRL
jgi:Na+-transporting NADH:ubiquinone oxidoreductase subunit NqrC